MPPDVREEPGLLALSCPIRVSSVSDHPSSGWERPKQAGWEFRVDEGHKPGRWADLACPKTFPCPQKHHLALEIINIY